MKNRIVETAVGIKANSKVRDNHMMVETADIKMIQNNGISKASAPHLPRFEGLKTVSEQTGLSYEFLRHLCYSGRVAHIRSGRKYLVNVEALAEYLNTYGQTFS